jgi:hypothetical protein
MTGSHRCVVVVKLSQAALELARSQESRNLSILNKTIKPHCCT